MKQMVLLFTCLSTTAQIYSQGGTTTSVNTDKIHQPKYCLFYDNHTMPACPDVGETFDAEAFTDRIKACGVDYLTSHARCNLGMALL
jgi:hypothetical protein